MKLKNLTALLPQLKTIKKDLKAAEKALAAAQKARDAALRVAEALDGVVVHKGHPILVEDVNGSFDVDSAAEDVRRYAGYGRGEDGGFVLTLNDGDAEPKVVAGLQYKKALLMAKDFVADAGKPKSKAKAA